MSVPSATLTLLAFLLVVGCATKEQQPTAAETAVGKYDKSGWGALRASNRMGSDHLNIASEELR
ncbi:MAG TPA: hypothetical protein VIS96_17275 [Terrimicrobiaceae bacterium]